MKGVSMGKDAERRSSILNIAGMTNLSAFIMLRLMFTGDAPGFCAGGVKVNHLSVLGVGCEFENIQQAQKVFIQVFQADATRKQALKPVGIADMTHILVSAGDRLIERLPFDSEMIIREMVIDKFAGEALRAIDMVNRFNTGYRYKKEPGVFWGVLSMIEVFLLKIALAIVLRGKNNKKHFQRVDDGFDESLLDCSQILRWDDTRHFNG